MKKTKTGHRTLWNHPVVFFSGHAHLAYFLESCLPPFPLQYRKEMWGVWSVYKKHGIMAGMVVVVPLPTTYHKPHGYHQRSQTPAPAKRLLGGEVLCVTFFS
jgi:hypothetical protein